MAKNLKDLNDILFDQLVRLSEKDISEESLDYEIKRTEAIVKVSSQIIGGANTLLNALKLQENTTNAGLELPHLLK